MTTEQGYNGWTNYETWQANLWLSESDFVRSIEDMSFDSVRELDDYIRETLEEFYLTDSEGNSLLDKASLVADILSSWLREVTSESLRGITGPRQDSMTTMRKRNNMGFVEIYKDVILDPSKDVLYFLDDYRAKIQRYGPYAALRNMARNGVPIEIAMLTHCGYIPNNCLTRN